MVTFFQWIRSSENADCWVASLYLLPQLKDFGNLTTLAN